jgi:hypothetical protein
MLAALAILAGHSTQQYQNMGRLIQFCELEFGEVTAVYFWPADSVA